MTINLYLYNFIISTLICIVILAVPLTPITATESPKISFKHLTIEDGLPYNQLYSVIEDKQGFVWSASIYGLKKYDGSSFTTYNHIPDAPNSLNNNFVWHLVEDRDGFIWVSTWGGGLNNFTKEITLRYDQSDFSFEFVALNFRTSEKNKYMYKMDGLNKNWIPTNADRRFASYTGLNSGTYIFKVKASNNDDLWNKEGVSIKIHVIPPWWQTLWFKIIVIITILGIILFVFYLQRKKAIRYQKVLENKIFARTKELQIANKAKGIFLANMSHELRTPLNAILGYANIIQRKEKYMGAISDGANVIQESGEHLLSLINDVLDLAKIEEGKLDLVPNPINLPSFIKGILNIIRNRIDEENVTLNYSTLSSLPHGVMVDKTRLRQVLINLLSNAIKFTTKGYINIQIQEVGKTISDKKNKTISLRFTIEDSGVGLTDDEMGIIFKAFEQVGYEKNRVEGMGLGLSITQNIINLMGGELHVKSKKGKGSTFWFDITLPITDDVSMHNVQYINNIKGYKGEEKTVLIADDNEYNCKVLCDILEPIGFKTITATNGQEAIDLALEVCPDMILMDILMSKKTGIEAMQEIRKLEKIKDILIVVTTASILAKDQTKSMLAGADAFLIKPIKVNELFEIFSDKLNISWILDKTIVDDTDRVYVYAEIIPPASKDFNILDGLVESGRILEIQDFAKELMDKDNKYLQFALKLLKLAKRFEIDKIQEWLDKYKTGET